MRVLLVMVVISLGNMVEAVVQDTVADQLLALDRKVVQGDDQVEDTDNNVVLFLIFLLFPMFLIFLIFLMFLIGNQVNDMDKRRRHPPPYMVKLFNDHTRFHDVDELLISSARNSYSHHDQLVIQHQ